MKWEKKNCFYSLWLSIPRASFLLGRLRSDVVNVNISTTNGPVTFIPIAKNSQLFSTYDHIVIVIFIGLEAVPGPGAYSYRGRGYGWTARGIVLQERASSLIIFALVVWTLSDRLIETSMLSLIHNRKHIETDRICELGEWQAFCSNDKNLPRCRRRYN